MNLATVMILGAANNNGPAIALIAVVIGVALLAGGPQGQRIAGILVGLVILAMVFGG